MYSKIPVVCPLCLPASATMAALPFPSLWGGKQGMPTAVLIKCQSPHVLLLGSLLRLNVLGQMCRVSVLLRAGQAISDGSDTQWDILGPVRGSRKEEQQELGS